MFKKVNMLTALTLVVGTASHAAPIDLAAIGLELGSPTLQANNGTAFFEPFFLNEFAADALSSGLEVVGVPGSTVSFSLSDLGPNEFSIFFPNPGLDSYDITEVGFTASTLEFLIDRAASNPIRGGVGDRAFVRVDSADFDFAAASPLDFFASRVDTAYDIDVTVRGVASTVVPIPLPAGAFLLLSGLLGLGVLRRRALG
jgi:hypothetical protein